MFFRAPQARPLKRVFSFLVLQFRNLYISVKLVKRQGILVQWLINKERQNSPMKRFRDFRSPGGVFQKVRILRNAIYFDPIARFLAIPGCLPKSGSSLLKSVTRMVVFEIIERSAMALVMLRRNKDVKSFPKEKIPGFPVLPRAVILRGSCKMRSISIR